MTLTISIDIDRSCDVSLTRQVQEAIRTRIETHVLHTGARLPSTRQLAADLGISRSVAVEAYEQLTAEGYLRCQQGSGTVVALPDDCTRDRTSPGASPSAAPSTSFPLVERSSGKAVPGAVSFDLRPGRASVVNFPRTEWLACYRSAVMSAGPGELDYPSLLGHPMLREELASYLGRVREVICEPEGMMVVSGFAQGLSLICEALPRLGIDRLAIEDPGHTGQRRFIRQTGMTSVPIPVDEEGLIVERLAESGARAVLVTPAHQFPTGYPMSPRRRAQLVRWATDVDGMIVEDDYDGDLWFDASARLPALQRLDPEHVVYAGTTSKVLVPGMRLGWIALPPQWRDLLRSVRSRRDTGNDSLSQRAFAEFVAGGVLDRHMRRVRSRYHTRRGILREALQRHLPMADVVGHEAGLHAYLRLPSWVDEQELVRAALCRSVLVDGGQDFQLEPGPRPPAIVVSYGAIPPSALTQSIEQIGLALQEQRTWSGRVPRATASPRPGAPMTVVRAGAPRPGGVGSPRPGTTTAPRGASEETGSAERSTGQVAQVVQGAQQPAARPGRSVPDARTA